MDALRSYRILVYVKCRGKLLWTCWKMTKDQRKQLNCIQLLRSKTHRENVLLNLFAKNLTTKISYVCKTSVHVPIACTSFSMTDDYFSWIINHKIITSQKYSWTIPWHGSGCVTLSIEIPIKFKLFMTIKIVKWMFWCWYIPFSNALLFKNEFDDFGMLRKYLFSLNSILHFFRW